MCKCMNCCHIVAYPEKYSSGTGYITCSCGERHRVRRVDMRTKPAPKRVTGRYHYAELSWRSALPDDYDSGRVRRRKRGKVVPELLSYRG